MFRALVFATLLLATFSTTVVAQESPTSDSVGTKSPWVSRKDRASRDAERVPWAAIIAGGPGYYLPIGSYYDGIDPGTSINGSLSIGTWSSLAFRTQVSFGNSATEISNIDFGYQRYSLGLLYHSRLNQSTRQASEFYGYWGIGAMTSDLSTGSGSGRLSVDDTRFMIDASIGVILAISREVGIDIAVDAPVIYGESTDNTLASAVQFNLRIGLAFTLGTQKQEEN